MKTNLKNGNAMVRLLLAHGEKIGILAIGICTALVIWSAIGRERLGREPNELDSLAKQAKSKVASFTWDKYPQEERIDAEPVPESAMATIPPSAFPIYEGTWDPAVSDPVTLRTDPVLLAAVDLEVNADSGLWASADPGVIKRKMLEFEKERKREEQELQAARDRAERAVDSRQREAGPGGYGEGTAGSRARKPARDAPMVERPRTGAQLQGFEEITAKSWVTVLAKVPIDQQTQQYIDSLRTSRGYNEAVDIPRYLGYQIDRAEVKSQGQGEWKKIAFIFDKVLIREISTYPVDVVDVIDPDVKHSTLTHPLPPLILREWGKRVSHSSMPLAEEKAKAEAKALQQPNEEDDSKESMSEDELFAEAEARRDQQRTASGEFGQMQQGGGGLGDMMQGEFRGEYGSDMEREYGGGYGGGGTLGRGSDATLEEFVWDQETPYLLFRYFDNTVEAGHSYRYRVRLNLRDVNHKVKPQYLDKTVSERREETGSKWYRWTDWSEPSPVAGVPMPARVYLVSSKPARDTNFNAEPEADILIKALNSEYAAEVARQESFNRGSVINIIDKAKVIWASKADEEDFPSFKFLTGITLLDFTGGDKLSRKNKEMVVPTRALLMDAAGHLFVQNEMEDLETVTEYEAIIEAGKEGRRRGGGSGGGSGGEYGDEYGGEYGGEPEGQW